MKPEKIILFDQVCPLCCWYTAGFEKLHWLQPGGRQPFPEGLRQWAAQLDPERARHEIPLIDTAGGPTLYGIDALLHLVGQRHPRLAALAGKPIFRRPLGLVYQFISYNRRVIAGSTGCTLPAEGAPAFHPFWRAMWFAVAATVVLAGIGARAQLLTTVLGTAPVLAAAADFWLLAAIVFGAAFVRTSDAWGRWAGHAVLGTLLWTPALLLPPSIPTAWATTLISALLTLDARRRCG